MPLQAPRELLHPEKGTGQQHGCLGGFGGWSSCAVGSVRARPQVCRRSWGPVGTALQEGGRGKRGGEPGGPQPQVQCPTSRAGSLPGQRRNVHSQGPRTSEIPPRGQEDTDAPRQTRTRNHKSGPKTSEEGGALPRDRHFHTACASVYSSSSFCRRPPEGFSPRTRTGKGQIWGLGSEDHQEEAGPPAAGRRPERHPSHPQSSVQHRRLREALVRSVGGLNTTGRVSRQEWRFVQLQLQVSRPCPRSRSCRGTLQS